MVETHQGQGDSYPDFYSLFQFHASSILYKFLDGITPPFWNSGWSDRQWQGENDDINNSPEDEKSEGGEHGDDDAGEDHGVGVQRDLASPPREEPLQPESCGEDGVDGKLLCLVLNKRPVHY